LGDSPISGSWKHPGGKLPASVSESTRGSLLASAEAQLGRPKFDGTRIVPPPSLFQRAPVLPKRFAWAWLSMTLMAVVILAAMVTVANPSEQPHGYFIRFWESVVASILSVN
jgi:hypothetical protein